MVDDSFESLVTLYDSSWFSTPGLDFFLRLQTPSLETNFTPYCFAKTRELSWIRPEHCVAERQRFYTIPRFGGILGGGTVAPTRSCGAQAVLQRFVAEPASSLGAVQNTAWLSPLNALLRLA
jgi:hypothetical protein